MTILGVGTDILHLSRIASFARRRSAQRLASRILCELEHNRWLTLRSSTERLRFLAVRWSVKEAAYKAVQPDTGLTWKATSFLNDPSSASQKPILQLAQGFALGIKFHASVSHDGDYVISMVVAETDAVNQIYQQSS